MKLRHMTQAQSFNPLSPRLSEQLDALVEQETRVRDLLTAAGQRLVERHERAEASHREVRARLDELGSAKVESPVTSSRSARLSPYEESLERIREVVAGATLPGSRVLVVSKGDPRLVEIPERTAWHFPRDEQGVYAGYHPADSAAAIAHLDELRNRGAEYLVFPRTAFWWLDYYGEFADYLRMRCRRVWLDDCCAIYDVTSPTVDRAIEPPRNATNWLAELVLGDL